MEAFSKNDTNQASEIPGLMLSNSANPFFGKLDNTQEQSWSKGGLFSSNQDSFADTSKPPQENKNPFLAALKPKQENPFLTSNKSLFRGTLGSNLTGDNPFLTSNKSLFGGASMPEDNPFMVKTKAGGIKTGGGVSSGLFGTSSLS